jgi:hypothetical protein
VASDLFPGDVVHEVGERQDWLCGLCGEPLHDENGDALVDFDAHHINRDVDDYDAENCVLLCREPERNCHLLIHAWNFQNHPVEDYDFRYFDGLPEDDDA